MFPSLVKLWWWRNELIELVQSQKGQVILTFFFKYNIMRLVFISDTHSLHDGMFYNLNDFIDPNQSNILIHAGDCSNVGKEFEVKEFVYWFQNIKGFDTKIFIAGNHDFAFERRLEPHHKGDYDWLYHLINEENLSQSDCVYLEDNEFTIIESPEFSRPIKFYGSPWQPEFFNWAFNLPRQGDQLRSKWDLIPYDTDILITHGPPFGYLDITPTNQRVGCELLAHRVESLKPLIHVFGHIHQSYGIMERNGVTYINASTCSEGYKPINKPIVIDVVEVSGKLTLRYI